MPTRQGLSARSIFSPAISLMNRLTYTAKFTTLGLMSVIAMAMVVTTLYFHLQTVVETATRELEGLNVLPAITRATRLMQQHRGRAATVLGGNVDFEAGRMADQLAATEALAALDHELPPVLAQSHRLKLVREGWKNLTDEGRPHDVGENLDAHTHLIGQMLFFIAQAGDHYALTLDPAIDTYYLIDSSIIKLPVAIEDLGQIRAYGGAVVAAKTVSIDEKVRMKALLVQLDQSLERLSDNIARAVQYNPSIRDELLKVSEEADTSFQRIRARVQGDIIDEQFGMSSIEFFTLTTEEIDRLYVVIDTILVPRGQLLLKERIQEARNKLLLSVGVATLLLSLVIYLTVGIYLATLGTIQSLGASALAFAEGNLNERIELQTQDELKQVGQSFNEMAGSFAALLVSQQQNERRLQVIIDTALDSVIQMNERGLIIGWNNQAELVFGWTREEVIGKSLAEVLIPERYRAKHRQGLADYLQTGQRRMLNARIEVTALHKDGYEIPVDLAVAANHIAGNVEFCAFLQDISQRVQTDEALKMSALVYENSSEAMMVTDPNGVILTINDSFTQVTGYEANEVIGQTPRMLRSGRHDTEFYRLMWKSLETTGKWKGEVWNRRKNGELYAGDLTINTIHAEDGSPKRRVAMFSDITDRKRSEEQIWRQANFDALTGLPNRSMFHHRLGQDIRKSHRSGSRLALMFLDLDRFKEVNDSLGHEMGDVLLKEAAKRLVGCVRETDTVARLGGDEFTIILSEINSQDRIDEIARTVLDCLSKPIQLGSELAYVSCSIGVTIYPTDAKDVDDLVRNADQAMYAAKYQGRNCYNYFTAAMQEAAQKRMRLSADLHQALIERQFCLCYQPIVDLPQGHIHKAEALIRWNHPTRGMVMPGEFVPLAEETRLVGQIDDWVFREAARQTAKWRAQYVESFQVSVNSSPTQLRNQADSDQAWFDHLKSISLPGSAIVVEVTEGQLIDTSSDVALKRLLRFRDAGIQVAIDDFGTGYSSLAYLRRFDIDYLKIDRTFTQGLGREADALALVEAIIVMAHKLGLKVIAEGIETEEQMKLLIATGCDYGQGYLFSRPVSAEKFEELLAVQKARAAA